MLGLGVLVLGLSVRLFHGCAAFTGPPCPTMHSVPQIQVSSSFFVGVDDANRSCILSQGLLKSECTETFEWVLKNYEAGAGGRRSKVLKLQYD